MVLNIIKYINITPQQPEDQTQETDGSSSHNIACSSDDIVSISHFKYDFDMEQIYKFGNESVSCMDLKKNFNTVVFKYLFLKYINIIGV